MAFKRISLCVFIFLLPLLSQAQQVLVTLKKNNASLLDVIESIQETTRFTFLYSDSQIKTVGHLKLDFNRTEINQVLKYCLKNSGLTYQIVDQTIIIVPDGTENLKRLPVEERPAEYRSLYFQLDGLVRDKEDYPMPGVSIYVKNGLGRGVASDGNGHFRMPVKIGDVLVFSCVGYRSKELFLKEVCSDIRMVLEENQEKLEEVQVVGFGTQRKVSVVGAISNMQVKERNFPVTSFSNMLSGAMAGIIGVQRNGEPGQDISEFWIRGISTFGANEKALILIDGVERNSFNDLMPEDIENLTVLKDATATAVYGARGANGVLLVTTRRGHEGRMQIRANGKAMLSFLPRLPEYLNAYDYARLSDEARLVRGEAPVFNEAYYHVIREGLDPDLYPDIDWQKELLRRWSMGSQVNLSVSGGGGIARYYISGHYRSNDAAYRESSLNSYHTNVRRRQYAFRTNLDLNITPSTLVGLNLAMNLVSMNRPGIGTTDQIWEIQADLNPLVVPLRFSTGQFPCYGLQDTPSPEVLLNETGYVSEFGNNTESKLSICQDLSRLLRGWRLEATIAFDVKGVQLDSRSKMPDLYRALGRDGEGNLKLEHRVSRRGMTYESSMVVTKRYYFEGKTNYERTFGLHRVSGLLLFNLQQYTSSESQDPLYAVPERYMGSAGRLTWSFRDTYFSEFNFGYNGSANFPKGRRFGFFPSVAAGCILTNVEWFKQHVPWLGFLKVRYSFGLVGNDQVAGLRFPYISYVNTNAPGYVFGGYGQNSLTGITESVVGTDNLRWERACKQDVGLEVGVGPLFVEFDYFQDLRKGIFMQRVNLPNTAGFPSKPYGNVGRMRNRGVEGTLTYKDKWGHWNWEVRGNFTYTTNKVLEYDEPHQFYDYQLHKGKSLNVARGFIALGYFRDSTEIVCSPKHMDKVRPGDIKYKDVNGDGVIDNNDIVPIGNSSIPRLQYGFAANVKWKNWDLGLFFRGSGAVAYFYGGHGFFPFISGDIGNVLKVVESPENRWIPAWYSGDPRTENPDARFPRLSYGANNNNYRPSTHWLADGRYLRLKTLEVGYSFPESWLYKLNINTLRISVLGDNLHVWDRIRLWDPEQASSNGAVYPLTRSILFNVQVVL